MITALNELSCKCQYVLMAIIVKSIIVCKNREKNKHHKRKHPNNYK